MQKVIISILILSSTLAFGQRTKETKRDKAINKIIGTWVFKDGEIKDNNIANIKLEKWHTDTIYFFSDMRIKFNSHDTMNDNIRKNVGLWDISENGETIILKNRQVTPSFDEPMTDLQLPIRLSANQLTITYPITLQIDPSVKDKSILQTERQAAINYIRIK